MLLIDFLHNSHTLVKLLAPAFMGILFTQSGLDKVFNYAGTHAYFTDHFKNSPLSNSVGLLLPVITILEVVAGIASILGCVLLLLDGSEVVAFWGLLLSAKALLALFIGQRLAKDYAGAVSLASYFVIALIGLLQLL